MTAKFFQFGRPTGSSMVEVVVATLLSGVVIVGALNVMGGAIKTRTVIAKRMDGPMLANELLAEIMSRSYKDPENAGTGALSGVGLEPGEANTRSTFDDIDDYLGWSASPPVDSKDQPMTQYTGWTRSVELTYVHRSDGSLLVSSDGLIGIRVDVTAPDDTITRRSGVRWKEGALERSPAIDSEIITWAGAELQIGAKGLVRAGTNLINVPTD